LAGVMYC